jgi:acyl-CoA synthetase (AMP-forming)/AMP-acid ligase II
MHDAVSALTGEFDVIQPLMDASVAVFGDRDAYVDGGERITFAGWMAKADSLAAEFRRRGVGRGDVVALMLPASIDYAAAAKLGAITTGINPQLGRREIGAIMAQCAPALVVRDEVLDLPDVPAGIAVLGRAGLPAAYGRRPLEKQAESAPDDIVTIIWTSGTAGQPKGASFGHRNLSAIAAAAGAFDADGGVAYLGCSKLMVSAPKTWPRWYVADRSSWVLPRRQGLCRHRSGEIP